MTHPNERPAIVWIIGTPPQDTSHRVGTHGIAEIRYYETNYGDHGIGEYLVLGEGGKLLASMSARHVAEIYYKTEDKQ